MDIPNIAFIREYCHPLAWEQGFFALDLSEGVTLTRVMYILAQKPSSLLPKFHVLQLQNCTSVKALLPYFKKQCTESRSGWTKIQQCMKMSTPPSLRCYGSNTLKYNAGKVYQNFLTSRACQSSAGQNPLTCLQLTYLLYDIGQNFFFCMLGIVSFKKPSHVQSCISQIVQ